MKSPHNQEYKKLMQQLRALTKVSPTLKALKQKALILVDPFIGTQGNPTGTSWKYCIDGFIDTEKDEYWEIDEWIKSNEFIGLSHGSIDSIHNDGCICKIIGFIRCCCWFGSSPPIVLVF